MDAGKYTVKAIFINSYGIKSQITSKELTIAVTKPYAPEVSMYSGTYTEPNEIEINPQEDQKCTIPWMAVNQLRPADYIRDLSECHLVRAILNL